MTQTPHLDWTAHAPVRQRTTALPGPDGRMFDLMLATPEGAAPAEGWPLLLVLDGERFFAAAAGAADSLARRSAKTGVVPMVVAGLAHRDGTMSREDQRARDFTTAPCAEPGVERPHGGGDETRVWLAGTVLSAITGATAIDAGRRTLFGHSLAGLFVLETVETAPALFGRWAAVSPSLWWRTPTPSAEARLLLGVGEHETAREMRGRLATWAEAAGIDPLIAARADHGSAPFALLPDVLRLAS